MKYSNLMIPAQESLFKDQIIIEREELITKNKPLLLFTAYDDIGYYHTLLTKLGQKYNYDSIAIVFWGNLLDYISSGKGSGITDSPGLTKLLIDADFKTSDQQRYVLDSVISIASQYSKDHNAFTVIYIDDFLVYSWRQTQSAPVLLLNMSRMKAYMNKYIKPWDSMRKIRDTNFNKAFSTKINKSLIVKWTPDLKLYHISKELNIKELEPRLTHRPLNAQENMRIPRISCAPTVDGCFRGAMYNENSIVRVYELQLNKDSLIVRPDRYLVPDRDKSDEYWVLTKTKVKPIALIQITRVDTPDGGYDLRFTQIITG